MSEKLRQDIAIGPNLKKLRMATGLSQSQVAAKLQTMDLPVTREMLSHIELGMYSVRISVLFGLCKLYNAAITDVFEGLNPDK